MPLTSEGLTAFHSLRPGSIAVAGAGGRPARDQRGTIRPQYGNGDAVAARDLGTYELTP